MSTLAVSQRARKVIASPMRKFLPFLQRAQQRGIKVYKLNVGDPDLAVPPIFFRAIRNYRSKTLSYAPSPGMLEHTTAWQKYYRQFGVRLKAENIIPTVGCAEAILFALLAVADPGDEVIVFEPVYTSYKSFSVMTGVKLVPITLSLENNFALPSLSVIEKKVTARTRAVVVVNPDNPTGKLWSRRELQSLIQLAKRRHLFVISDETYREIRFQGRPMCLLAERNARQHVILVDSVSKRFSMPGARIGCVASFNQEVMAAILKFAQARLSAGTLEQLATVPLLHRSQSYTRQIRQEYLRRRKVVTAGLRRIPGAIFKPAQGAFYQTVTLPVTDAEDFVKFTISQFHYQGRTVMVTPLQDFYMTKGLGKNQIRIAYVLNVKDLRQAMQILKKALEAYLKVKT